MSRARVIFGKTGEDLACEELARRGYVILARRYRRRGGELDIVAREGETMVFVEVKTREGHDFGDGAEAVTLFKQRRMLRVAQDFLMRHHIRECPCRFDVVCVHLEDGRSSIEIFANAFSL